MSFQFPSSFWDEVTRAINGGFLVTSTQVSIGPEQYTLSEVARVAWRYFLAEKYHSRERFRCIEDFIDAAEKDKKILKIEPGDYPGEYFLRTKNLEWCAKTLFNHDATKSLIDISVRCNIDRWVGSFNEGVIESLEIMKDIDALVQEFQRRMKEGAIEANRKSIILGIEKTTSNADCLPYDLRRKVIKGKCTYLVDDVNGTAWISRCNTTGKAAYTIPETVMLEGKLFNIKSVEIGAFDDSPDIEELIVPDNIEYIDEDSFKGCPKLRRVHIGKGLEHYHKWSFSGCPIEEITIDPDNPHIKLSDDGNMVLSKDGKELHYTIRDIKELVVPEGVTVLGECAISYLKDLEKLVLPSTLRTVGPNAIYGNKRLKEIILPPSVCLLKTQALSENESLETVDFPESIHKIFEEVLMLDEKITTLILRSKSQVIVEGFRSRFEILPKCGFSDLLPENCTLLVPKELVDTYKKHPLWSSFKEIAAIPEKE